MKKTFALVLALALVSALCGMLFVSAEDTNLAAGKGWTGETDIGTTYVGNLTDGVIDPDGKYDTTLWYGADNRLEAAAENNGAFTMIVELGAAYDVDNARIHVWPAGTSGIVVPASIDFYASADGENYEKIGSVTSFDGTAPQWVSVDLDEAVTASHIRIDMVGAAEGDTGVFWFASEIEVYGSEAADDTTSEPADESSEPADESSEAADESSDAAVESSEEAVESSEAAVESSEAPKTGDAGILVFAVLGVAAICGAAIAIKARG